MNILAAAVLMYDVGLWACFENVLKLGMLAICLKNRPFGFSKFYVIAFYPDTIREFDFLMRDYAHRVLYISPSMHGTLLDQRVFEALVQRCLPMIHEHFQVVDVQLSVASLPWFLSLWVLGLSRFWYNSIDSFLRPPQIH